ncbi:hypothetical protein HY406_00670 [Candidatus Giovannonibacteria bacterium]|nr:hypothetical protein [Candidatus Giovannonibacteria bacterium]
MKIFSSFLLAFFFCGLWATAGAREASVTVCPEDPLKNAACELLVEAERLLGEREEAAYENRGVVLHLLRPPGDFVLFVPVPRDTSRNLGRFRVFYLARDRVTSKWHEGSVRRFGFGERYVVDETPSAARSDEADQATIRMFLESLRNSREFPFEFYF